MAKILIADDAPFFRLMLKDLLEKGGHEVIFAENGDEAVSRAQEEGAKLDLLVLDMVLPKKTGLEVLMDLSDSPFKILCVTGNDQVHEFEELRELGASHMLSKSTPADQILYHINQLLYKKEGPQRVHPRVLLSVQINYRTPDKAFVSNTFTLSAQGVFVKAQDLLPLETPLSLAFFLPTKDQSGKEIDCKGKVVRLEEGHNPSAVRGMGIVFTEISPFDRQMISDFVQQQAK